MGKEPQEWFKQADYDIDTAEFMFKGGRYFYTIFMCHLSIEKALKGLYTQKFKGMPPKIHNLLYFIEKIQLELPDDLFNFVFLLNRVSIPTRYPDDLQRILKEYDKKKVHKILGKSKEILKWLKERL